MTAPQQPLQGGEMLSAISNAIVGLLREHYGRGPTKAKTYVLDDLLVCVMRDGFTAIEQTMMEGGQQQRVVELRQDFQVLMESSYKEQVKRITGAKVIAFLSQAHVEPDLTIEMFLMDRPLRASGRSRSPIPRATGTRARTPGHRPAAPGSPPADYDPVRHENLPRRGTGHRGPGLGPRGARGRAGRSAGAPGHAPGDVRRQQLGRHRRRRRRAAPSRCCGRINIDPRRASGSPRSSRTRTSSAFFLADPAADRRGPRPVRRRHVHHARRAAASPSRARASPTSSASTSRAARSSGASRWRATAPTTWRSRRTARGCWSRDSTANKVHELDIRTGHEAAASSRPATRRTRATTRPTAR